MNARSEPPLLDAEDARRRLWSKHRLSFSLRDFEALMRTPCAPPARGPKATPFRLDDLDAWASEARKFAAVMDRARTRG